jgi:hypothetical protein
LTEFDINLVHRATLTQQTCGQSERATIDDGRQHSRGPNHCSTTECFKGGDARSRSIKGVSNTFQDRSALFSGHIQPCTAVMDSSCGRGYALNLIIRGGLHPRHDFTGVGVLQLRGQVDGSVRPFAINQVTSDWQFNALGWGGGHDFSSAE